MRRLPSLLQKGRIVSLDIVVSIEKATYSRLSLEGNSDLKTIVPFDSEVASCRCMKKVGVTDAEHIVEKKKKREES